MSQDPKLVLVVDDLRSFVPPRSDAQVIYCRNVTEAQIELAQHSRFDELWLDHDLGSGGETIQLIPQLLALASSDPKWSGHVIIYIHTTNTPGRKNLLSALTRWYNVGVVWPTDHDLIASEPWPDS